MKSGSDYMSNISVTAFTILRPPFLGFPRPEEIYCVKIVREGLSWQRSLNWVYYSSCSRGYVT